MNVIKALTITSLLGLAALSGCTDADVASSNLSKAADNFEVNRRVVFYNGITGDYMLTVEGLCSLGNQDSSGQLSITCKVGPNAFKKHPFNDLRASLEKSHEVELSGGLVNERAVVIIFGTPDGSTWTAVAVGVDGKACIIANGQSWFQSALQKGDPV